MDLYFILLLVVVIFLGVVFYFLRKKLKQMDADISKLKNAINQMMLENLMTTERTDTLFKESASVLARRLFKLVKRKFELYSVTTYPEMVEELEKATNIEPKMKESLKDFFNTIILLEYSKRSLSDTEKVKLKKEAIELIKKLAQPHKEKG